MANVSKQQSLLSLWHKSLKWDFLLQVRYNIFAIALIVSGFYIGCWQIVGDVLPDTVLVLLLFSDPAMLGFVFVGVLVMTEKDNNTLQALIVSARSAHDYILSKVLTLTVTAMVCSLLIALVVKGFSINYGYLCLGVGLSSVLFILLGFIAATRVRSFNEYVFVLPFFMLPLCLPFLNYFGLTDLTIFYLIPTQAALLLLDAAFEGAIAGWALGYAILYLLAWSVGAWLVALKYYQKYLAER